LDPEIKQIDRQILLKNSFSKENDFQNESNSNFQKSIINKKIGNSDNNSNLALLEQKGNINNFL
jgi:hypothetical protein